MVGWSFSTRDYCPTSLLSQPPGLLPDEASGYDQLLHTPGIPEGREFLTIFNVVDRLCGVRTKDRLDQQGTICSLMGKCRHPWHDWGRICQILRDIASLGRHNERLSI